MEITLNGERRDVAKDLTIASLIDSLELQAPRVAVLLNAQVVARASHPTTTIREHDVVDIVTLAGGG